MNRTTLISTLVLFCIASPAFAAAAPDSALAAVLECFEQDEHADLRGVVVMSNGHIVAEHYYNGESVDTLHDIRSAGKSITSLLVGIAIDKGKIRGVDDTVARHWPAATGSSIGETALRDVLTMRSGLSAFDEDPASPGNEDRMDEATDPSAFVLSIPRADPPGTQYRYNSATAYVAGVVVAKAVGLKLADFARIALFTPLGITRWEWASDAAGYTKGQGNLSLTTRDFATIGEMVREGGRYNGNRIVSAVWLRDALTPKVIISDRDPYADGYGFFWYTKKLQIDGKSVAVSFASGNGGNKLYVVSDRHVVVAITSSAYGHGYGQRRSENILKAILGAKR